MSPSTRRPEPTVGVNASWPATALAAATALAVAGMFARDILGIGGTARPWLLAASTGFVLTALVRGVLRTQSGRYVLLALVGCWLGDYFGPTHFALSVLAFLAAHLLLIGAFIAMGVALRRVAVGSAGVLIAGVAIGLWLLPHVPLSERILIIAYMVVISAMVAVASGIRRGPGSAMMLAAAIVFYVSDIFVARWRFVAPGPLNAWLCYPLYYASCLLFALGVPTRDADAANAGR